MQNKPPKTQTTKQPIKKCNNKQLTELQNPKTPNDIKT